MKWDKKPLFIAIRTTEVKNLLIENNNFYNI